jgi:putative FmdB family regulatory protein
MPVYEYRCNACGRDFEYQQRMSDPDKTSCEACGEDRLERLISRTAFQLKGSGWYKDLYSSSKPDKPAASEPASSGDKPAASGGDASTPASSPSTSGSTGGSDSGGGSSSTGGGSSTKSAASPAS